MRKGRLAAVIGLGLLLVGCERGDPRLERLSAGIAKDSVLAIMGGQPQRTDPFLVNGQYIEAMFFPIQSPAEGDSLTDRDMSPVVLINSTLAGWGWAYWDSAAAANRIPTEPKTESK